MLLLQVSVGPERLWSVRVGGFIVFPPTLLWDFFLLQVSSAEVLMHYHDNILNKGTLGRHDIWSCGDVSGTVSKQKYENVNGKTVDKKNSLYLSRAPALLLPPNIAEQEEINTELCVALADCTYIQKTGAPFPYETAFMSKKKIWWSICMLH